MENYILFGKYSQNSLKEISKERTEKSIALIKEHGGELKAGYALLGEVDLVLIVKLPDIQTALKVSMGLTKLLGIAFHTAPAVSMEEFDKLIAK